MNTSLSFGAWLLKRPDRGNWTDDLAAVARSDRRFPAEADPDGVRRHLAAQGATGDAFEQVDDAELDWLAW